VEEPVNLENVSFCQISIYMSKEGKENPSLLESWLYVSKPIRHLVGCVFGSFLGRRTCPPYSAPLFPGNVSVTM